MFFYKYFTRKNYFIGHKIIIFLLLQSALILFYLPVLAQDYNEDVENFVVQQSHNPDAKAYLAFSKAVFLERLAQQLSSIREQTTANSYRKELGIYLRSAIELDPRSAFLRVRLAENLYMLSDIANARSEIDMALKLDPDNADAHFLLGSIKYSAVRGTQDTRLLTEAIEEFKSAVKSDPEHLKAQYYLASLSYQIGDYAQAAQSYAEMIKLRPYEPDIRFRLGVSYSEIGEINKAIDSFRAVTMLREDHIDARFRLANLYARQSRNKEAIDECLTILKRTPDSLDVNLLLAQLYVSEYEYDKAIPIIDEILRSRDISRKPIFAEAYYRRGLAYKGKGEKDLANKDFQRSISIYKLLLEKESENVGANYDIALVYEALEDYDSAEKHLLRHIELKPNEPNVYNYLGYMLIERNKDLDRAIEYIKKALEMEPNNGAFLDSLGWAYFKIGNIEEAITILEKAAEIIPTDSDIREHLGYAYFKKGGDFSQRAVSEWEKAIELKPWKTALKQKLDDLRKSVGLSKTSK